MIDSFKDPLSTYASDSTGTASSTSSTSTGVSATLEDNAFESEDYKPPSKICKEGN